MQWVLSQPHCSSSHFHAANVYNSSSSPLPAHYSAMHLLAWVTRNLCMHVSLFVCMPIGHFLPTPPKLDPWGNPYRKLFIMICFEEHVNPEWIWVLTPLDYHPFEYAPHPPLVKCAASIFVIWKQCDSLFSFSGSQSLKLTSSTDWHLPMEIETQFEQIYNKKMLNLSGCTLPAGMEIY